MKNLSKTQKILLDENNSTHETFMLYILLLAATWFFAILINTEFICIPEGTIYIIIYILSVLFLYTICLLFVLKIIKEFFIKHNIKNHILKNDYVLEECSIISYDISIPVLYLTIKTTTQTLTLKCRYNENVKYIYTNKPCHLYIVGKTLLCKLVP